MSMPVLSFLLSMLLPPTAADDEATLLMRVARADRAALKALYDRLGRQALAVAFRVLGSRTDAEDALQETFLDVWKRSAAFDPARGSGRAWVLSMVRNRAIDRLRTRGAIGRLSDRVTDDRSAAPPRAPTPLEDVERLHARQRVQAALTELNADQRRVLEMAYFEGLSQTEIATKLQEPLGTIKSRVRTAMEKLALLLPHAQAESGHA